MVGNPFHAHTSSLEFVVNQLAENLSVCEET